MNETQIKILGAFEATMQAFVDTWENPSTSLEQVAMAYGGASAMLLLARQTTDIIEAADHAAILLNQAAEQLGLPQTN